jgi:uncharacterized protein YfaS (alpha-2-macroglobulin family)
VVAVRQNFPDTPFWEAHLQTGSDGQADVTVTLPDTLTTWRMDARAATVDTRVGQATQDLISTRPLIVRPQTPRFFVVGDQVTLGAALQNNTDQPLTVEVKLVAQGLTLGTAASRQIELRPSGRPSLPGMPRSTTTPAGGPDLPPKASAATAAATRTPVAAGARENRPAGYRGTSGADRGHLGPDDSGGAHR